MGTCAVRKKVRRNRMNEAGKTTDRNYAKGNPALWLGMGMLVFQVKTNPARPDSRRNLPRETIGAKRKLFRPFGNHVIAEFAVLGEEERCMSRFGQRVNVEVLC